MATDLNFPTGPLDNEGVILDQQRWSRQDQARMFDPAVVADPTNKPLYVMRFNSAVGQWQRWNGTGWPSAGALAHDISGNAATATTAAACSGNSATATNATNTTNITVTDDNATNAAVYPVWSTGAGIVLTKISSTRVYFNPSTGDFTVGGRMFCGQNVLLQSAGTLTTTGIAYTSLRDSGGERGWFGFGLGDGSVGVVNLTGGPVKIFGGGGYHTFNAAGVTLGAGAFNGAGTGLTGTAASLSIGGNAATATNSTNASNLTGVAGTAGYSVSGATVSYNTGAGGPTVNGQGGGAAMMTFARPSAYAVNFGLDTDNKLKVGGYSMGALSYAMYHEGNKPGIGNIVDNRTWSNLSGSRAAGTTYTNTNPYPIKILIGFGGGSLTPTIGANTLPVFSSANGSTNTVYSFDVPAGSNYSVASASGLVWWEYS